MVHSVSLTCHPKRPPQPLRALLCTSILKIHLADPDYLTNQVNFIPVEVFVSKILWGKETKNYPSCAEWKKKKSRQENPVIVISGGCT